MGYIGGLFGFLWELILAGMYTIYRPIYEAVSGLSALKER